MANKKNQRKAPPGLGFITISHPVPDGPFCVGESVKGDVNDANTFNIVATFTELGEQGEELADPKQATQSAEKKEDDTFDIPFPADTADPNCPARGSNRLFVESEEEPDVNATLPACVVQECVDESIFRSLAQIAGPTKIIFPINGLIVPTAFHVLARIPTKKFHAWVKPKGGSAQSPSSTKIYNESICLLEFKNVPAGTALIRVRHTGNPESYHQIRVRVT